MRIELRNYRAFDDTKPAGWDLNDGFTAFVGLNNSGKSSLIRFFHEARQALVLLDRLNDGGIQEMVKGTAQGVQFTSVADNAEVFCNRNTRDMTATFVNDASDIETDAGLEASAVRFRWQRPSMGLTIELEALGQPVTILDWTVDVLEVGPMVAVAGQHMRLDLRRIRVALRDLANGLYLGPFRNAVNIGGNSAYYDLQIGQQFIAQWDAFKTGPNRAQNREAIAVEKELRQIFGLGNLSINASPGDATLHVIANDQPYQLQEHGAGFAQFIVVMAYVATRRPPYVFIDEPELNLHPSLQIDFLTALAGYCRRGVAFATHSIGLARAVAQEIYSVRRLDDETREVRPLEGTRDYVQFLGELSFSGYSELGFNHVLLVEGTTEVPTIQRWLRFYGIEHEVVLLPLGGGSLINATSASALGEIRRITTEVSVVIDSERTSAAAALDSSRRAFVDRCEDLGFTVHVLERRALENYFTDAAVKQVKGDKYGALGEYERLRDVELGWAKNESWRIASKMERQDLDVTDLGVFLADLAERVRG